MLEKKSEFALSISLFEARISNVNFASEANVMLPVNKKIVTDEAMRPVAVLIDYQDWQKIEKILEIYQLQQQEFNLNNYVGIIQLTQDP